MSPDIQQPKEIGPSTPVNVAARKSGVGPVFSTLVLVSPAVGAYWCCFLFMHDPHKVHTYMWFSYEALRAIGWIGIAGASLLVLIVAVRQRTRQSAVIFMVACVVIGILLQLAAADMYRSPWV